MLELLIQSLGINKETVNDIVESIKDLKARFERIEQKQDEILNKLNEDKQWNEVER